MRRSLHVVLVIALVLMLPSASFGATIKRGTADSKPIRSDFKMDPLTEAKLALRDDVLQATLDNRGTTPQWVENGRPIELAREGNGQIWTLLTEFSDMKHNQIPQPNRLYDNSTYWESNFSRAYYNNLLYNSAAGVNSMANYYEEQSSNRFSVAGDSTEWVAVPGTAVSYDDSPDANVWNLLADGVDGWYASQVAAGKTPDEINAYLAQFDVWDRYDFDADGDTDEPDGYIDTFQVVHAGEGEEAGGGALGDQAIWSHSWYAYSGDIDKTGPAFNLSGGIQVGDSDFWVGKYTIQPENGGLGVFVHEFGHDLGLPDLYDTAGGENGTAFWTLMSSGSWLSDGNGGGIGTKSSHMGAWEKFMLGWLNYDVAFAGETYSTKLNPMEYTTSAYNQGLFVVLPDKQVTIDVGDPYAGSKFYYSGNGNEQQNFLYKQFELGEGATLAAKVNYAIEKDWDYLYVCYSLDGELFHPLTTNLSSATNPNGNNIGDGITGSSSGYVDLTADLPAGNIWIGFVYITDEAVSKNGAQIDNISITGADLDGAETDTGWSYYSRATDANGWVATTGISSAWYKNYYVAEYRTYKGYDSTLKTGPYFFGYLNNKLLENKVDFFPYQKGMLVNYWDTSQIDNETLNHPGKGLVLPVDSHPKALKRVDGKLWRNRVQSYDSTFWMSWTTPLNLHVNSVLSPVRSQIGVTVFDDTKSWYDPTNPMGSVITPNTGTQIKIDSYGLYTDTLNLTVKSTATVPARTAPAAKTGGPTLTK